MQWERTSSERYSTSKGCSFHAHFQCYLWWRVFPGRRRKISGMPRWGMATIPACVHTSKWNRGHRSVISKTLAGYAWVTLIYASRQVTTTTQSWAQASTRHPSFHMQSFLNNILYVWGNNILYGEIIFDVTANSSIVGTLGYYPPVLTVWIYGGSW